MPGILIIFACLAIMPPMVCRGQSGSDGREWANAGGKFDAAKVLADLPPGYRFEHVMVPLRDGVRLATTDFLPPGDGESEGKPLADPVSSVNEIADSKNTLD